MPTTGMMGVSYNSNFEEMKRSIQAAAQNSNHQTSHINNYLLEKHSMEELLTEARNLNARLGSNNFLTPNYFQGHFKWLKKHGWLIEEKDGYYQIVGFKGSKSTGQLSSVQVEALKQDQGLYLPTKEDCEQAIEKLKYIKTTSSISENEVLSFLESQLNDKYHLQNNWREITKRNFNIWFNK